MPTPGAVVLRCLYPPRRAEPTGAIQTIACPAAALRRSPCNTSSARPPHSPMPDRSVVRILKRAEHLESRLLEHPRGGVRLCERVSDGPDLRISESPSDHLPHGPQACPRGFPARESRSTGRDSGKPAPRPQPSLPADARAWVRPRSQHRAIRTKRSQESDQQLSWCR
jgi:hypothetical protein